ncbi:hypothetical protein NFI96_009010 [Prochilodus magdalenae]|nr:hypothetical protein NFI96_009010 [Prochilodus magdalenae]
MNELKLCQPNTAAHSQRKTTFRAEAWVHRSLGPRTTGTAWAYRSRQYPYKHQSPISSIMVLCSLPTCVPHYHFINEMKNWTEAQRYCRESYTDLATVHSMVEMKELNEAIKSSSISQRSVWIGLRRGNTKKWMWSMADARFYKEGEAEFRRWRSGAPSDSADKDCAVMHQDGFWNESSCSQLNRYVCYNGETDNYLSYPDVKNWREAQRFCREHYTDLVSMRNEFENSASVATIWIGLFRDSWTWSDQSDSSFRYWTSDQPDNLHGGENCTAVRTNGSDFGQWEDLGCGQQLPFVCSKTNSSVSPSPKVTTASPDSHKETPTQSAPPTMAPETQPATNHVFLVRENMTWREALRHCRDHYVNLVSVHSETIQRWVMEVAGKASTSHVWLGLRHTCSQGIWYWVSGFNLCYVNWAPGFGSGVEDCSVVERTGAVQVGGNQQWVSLPETQRLNFICTNYEDGLGQKSCDSGGVAGCVYITFLHSECPFLKDMVFGRQTQRYNGRLTGGALELEPLAKGERHSCPVL